MLAKNILIICKKVPFPAMDGESIVIMSDMERLKALGHTMHVFCLNTQKQWVDTSGYSDLSNWDSFEAANIDTNDPISSLWYSVRSKTPFHMARFYKSSIHERIEAIIKHRKIDVIVCQGLSTTLFAGRTDMQKLIYRAHNIESRIWIQMMTACKNPIKRILYGLIAKSLERYEQNNLARFKIATLSQAEEKAMKTHLHLDAYTIPIAIDRSFQTAYNPQSEGILFVGSLDWLPNLEGLDWFINKVYPAIDNIPLTIAGKGKRPPFAPSKNVQFALNFENIEDLFATHRIMIVPLLSGAGIRIKILEALNYGLPVISTQVGAEGIVEDNSIIELENNSDAFADKIRKIYHDEAYLIAASIREKELVREFYSIKAVEASWNSILSD